MFSDAVFCSLLEAGGLVVRLNRDEIYNNISQIEVVATALIELCDSAYVPDLVVSSALKGWILSQYFAVAYNKKRGTAVQAIDARKSIATGKFSWTGLDETVAVEGNRVVVLDDSIHTGRTAAQMIAQMRDQGASIDQCLVLFNHEVEAASLGEGVKLKSVFQLPKGRQI